MFIKDWIKEAVSIKKIAEKLSNSSSLGFMLN